MPTKERYITEYGIPGCVPNGNMIEDLEQYLALDPYPLYRLVSCQFLSSGMFLLIWEDKK